MTNAAEKPVPKFRGQTLAVWFERFQKAATRYRATSTATEKGTLSFLQTKLDEEMEEAALAIVGFRADAVPSLIEMLDDRSDEFREMIYELLGAIGPDAKTAVPKLVAALKQKLVELQKLKSTKEGPITKMKLQQIEEHIKQLEHECSSIIEVFHLIGPDAEEAVPVLIASLKDPELAEEAIQALYGIGPSAKSAIPAIRRTVLNAKTRFDWLDELYTLGPDAIPVLLEFLKEGDANDQHCSARALGRIKPAVKQATPMLRKLLQSNDRDVRYSAAEALWRIERDNSIVPILIPLVEEGNLSAIELLGEIGPGAKLALPALSKAAKELKDGSEVVVIGTKPKSRLNIAAEEALQKIEVKSRPNKEKP